MENKIIKIATNYIERYNEYCRKYAEISVKLNYTNDMYTKEPLSKLLIEYGGQMSILSMFIADLREALKGIAVIEYKMLNKRFVFNDKRHNITYSEYSIKAVVKGK